MLRSIFAITALIVTAHLLDSPALALRVDGLGDADWHRALRVAGFLPVWMAIGAALALHRCTALFIDIDKADTAAL